MDIEKIEKLIKLLDESNLSEIAIKEEEGNIRLSKQVSKVTAQPAAEVVQQPVPQQQPAPQPSPSIPTDSMPQQPAESEEPAGETVRSPMVGTFYLSPSPDAAPFVQVGSKVKAGDTVCIVEAMKIMNQIESEVSGTVQKILVEDGTPVEYDQPLFIIG